MPMMGRPILIPYVLPIPPILSLKVMRILVITNLYPLHHIGGYELRCQTIVRELAKRGHDVHVLTSDHHVVMPRGKTERLVEIEPVERSLRVHGFYGHPWLPIQQLHKLEIHNNDMVRAMVARVQPDVVHVWNLGGISKSILHTLEMLKLPVAYDISDHWIARSLQADVWLDWWNRCPGDGLQKLARGACKWLGLSSRWSKRAPMGAVSTIRFRRIYFCSDAMRRITAAKGYQVGHGEVIHCPVDVERFNSEPVQASRPLRKLLYVGRLAEDKGTLTALRALALIQRRFHGTLHVYGHGDPDYTARLTNYARDHDLPVTFHSARPDEMPAVYEAHDALLFTSEWEEPFALTPLEAMASGIPVIGTMTGGSAELLQDGINALTYQAGSAQRLAEAIMKLASDGALRQRIATTGQRQVRKLCSLPTIVDQVEEFLATTQRDWSAFVKPAEQAARGATTCLSHRRTQLAAS
jgi:glycogen synthase